MQHNDLPKVSGVYKFDYPLGSLSFFKVGGNCDVLFYPEDENDLMNFLQQRPEGTPIAVLGNISNTLISDAGFHGCIIKLDKLNKMEFFDGYVKVGTGLQLSVFIKRCIERNLSCCEKLFCIPGTLGGSVVMNAGVPDFEIADVLISIEIIDFQGNKKVIRKEELQPRYRNGNIPQDSIVTAVNLKTSYKASEDLNRIISDIKSKRLRSQPIGQATCGSTFKNPPGVKAWELIKSANCDKLSVGDAMVSDIHCNFLINAGHATARDFLKLIEIIKTRVFEKTGIMLEEEIKILGEV